MQIPILYANDPDWQLIEQYQGFLTEAVVMRRSKVILTWHALLSVQLAIVIVVVVCYLFLVGYILVTYNLKYCKLPSHRHLHEPSSHTYRHSCLDKGRTAARDYIMIIIIIVNKEGGGGGGGGGRGGGGGGGICANNVSLEEEEEEAYVLLLYPCM